MLINNINTIFSSRELKLFLIAVVLSLFVTAQAFSQIPNNRFENWTNTGNYLTPDEWWTSNDSAAGTFYPVTRSTDHYPLAVGNYSLRLENNISLLPDWGAMGIAWTGGWEGNNYPVFPITGHPLSLCGYYKFIPQNNDTMEIHIRLYKNGVDVSGGQFKNSAAMSSWGSFSIPLSAYADADSARIMILSCYNNDFPFPLGNSVLYVDNLSFDSLITDGIPETADTNPFFVYPNPASEIIKIDFNKKGINLIGLEIYNAQCQEVFTEKDFDNNDLLSVNVSGLAEGFYIVRIKTSEEQSYFQKLQINR